jgi:hypothetical protein
MNAVERYYKAASKYEKVKYKTTKVFHFYTEKWSYDRVKKKRRGEKQTIKKIERRRGVLTKIYIRGDDPLSQSEFEINWLRIKSSQRSDRA